MNVHPSENPTGPMRLRVASLHSQITEDMLRSIFEPFGKIDNVQLVRDLDTGLSKGYGFITFQNVEDGKVAMKQLNGFELAGLPIKIDIATECFSDRTPNVDRASRNETELN